MSERRCLVTGEVRDTRELLRFVAGPDDRVVPDVAGDLPGRGMWLCPRADYITRAVKKGLFSRSARRKLGADNDLAATASRLIRRRCLDYLGLARRSGEVSAGLEKVRAVLTAGRVAVLIAARDGAEQGHARLRVMAGEAIRVNQFDRHELGLALGRENVVHAALAPGRLADRFVTECARLASLEPIDRAADLTET
jgi:predicted RNA-binding protein YlxR (DUF448 family)